MFFKYIRGQCYNSKFVCYLLNDLFLYISNNNLLKHSQNQGMEKRATDIYTTVRKGHEQKGFTGALGSVLRQLPPTLIEPILLTTEATSNVIGGLRNQLVPNRKKEDEDKYKGGEIE